MTKKILMGASFLALLAAAPAFAETKANAEASTSTKIEANLDKAGNSIEKTADKAGASIERAAEKTKAGAKEAYADVKAYFSDDDDIKAVSNINVMERVTADELIGATVQNPKGEEIGKIKDILITADGDAETVIINDSKLGLGGKLAAFDYDVIEGIANDKDIVVKLNEENIKSAKRFEYEANPKADANTVVMPANQFSVAKIMDAKVVDPSGKAVADVDTVAFEGDDADYIVVTFNRILGMGGDKAALNIEALDILNEKGKYTFKLNQQQTAQFESYKETTKAN